MQGDRDEGWGRVRRGVARAASVAGMVSLGAAALAGDKGLPKRPDRPFALAVIAAAQLAPTPEAQAKAEKEVADTIADITGNVTGKRKEWFTLVDDPAQAEIILEILGRGRESGHG